MAARDHGPSEWRAPSAKALRKSMRRGWPGTQPLAAADVSVGVTIQRSEMNNPHSGNPHSDEEPKGWLRSRHGRPFPAGRCSPCCGFRWPWRSSPESSWSPGSGSTHPASEQIADAGGSDPSERLGGACDSENAAHPGGVAPIEAETSATRERSAMCKPKSEDSRRKASDRSVQCGQLSRQGQAEDTAVGAVG